MKSGISSIVVLLFLFTADGFASLVGTDNASANAYSDGWDNGDDGFVTGDGAFGAWNLSTTGFSAGFFRGDSTGLVNGGLGANINSGGLSFGMWGTNNYADAKRSFDSPLVIGQTFSIDLAVNEFNNGFKGINIYDSNDIKLFNFNVGGSKYAVNDLPSTVNISFTRDQNTAFKLSFTQTSSTGGTWSVVRSGGVSSSNSGAYSGVANSFHLYVGGTNGGNTNDLYANNMSISAVPEASALLFGGLICSVLGLTVAGRRALAWLHGKNTNPAAA